jgi:hypothetical protein
MTHFLRAGPKVKNISDECLAQELTADFYELVRHLRGYVDTFDKVFPGFFVSSLGCQRLCLCEVLFPPLLALSLSTHLGRKWPTVEHNIRANFVMTQ